MGGAIVATLGCILPSCIIVTILAWLYIRYKKLDTMQQILTTLRPAVVAMIVAAGVSIIITAFFGGQIFGISTFNISAVIIFGICLFLLIKYRINPIIILILAGFLNIISALIMGKI